MLDAILELPEPPRGDLGQNRTFMRNRLRHHDVERADAISCHEQKSFGVDLVDVAHFSAPERFQWQRARLHHHQTLRPPSRAELAVSPANIGVTTSRRNSSTCSGARPTNRFASS